MLKASSCGEENAKIKTLNGIIWMEIGDGMAAYQSFKAATELDEGFEAPKTILKAYFNEHSKSQSLATIDRGGIDAPMILLSHQGLSGN